jgi:hypothetical protein
LSFLEYGSYELKNLPSIVCIVTGKTYFIILFSERFYVYYRKRSIKGTIY